MSDDANTDTETLLDALLGLTGLEREDDESAEDFKARIVRHFADTYPNTDEGNAAFDALDSGVTEWVDAATEVHRANRGSRNKKRLPELQGLEEDEDKPKRAGRAAKEPKEPKEKKEKKTRAEGAGRKPRDLAATFEPAPEDAMVSKFLSKEFTANGYKKQKERSPAGHIVYINGDEHEIHVGPGKTEQAYMMGWKGQEQTNHSYGGEDLAKYLAERK